MGNERNVKFWKDLWCKDQALKDAFPNLFRLTVNKDQWICDAWDEEGEVGSWNLLFLRSFNDWEMEEVEGLFQRIYHLVLHSDVEDVLSWKISKNGFFSVRSLYRSLTSTSSEPFPWNIIWRSWAPIRVSFFAWKASWNIILTTDQLKRRGWILLNRCYLCKMEEETSDYLLLFCKKATMLWNLFFSLFDVQWVLHSSIKRNLIAWHGASVSKGNEKAWRAAPFCLMWTLWRERNERVFNDNERTDQALKLSFLYTFVNWGRVYLEDHSLSLFDFIEWLFSS